MPNTLLNEKKQKRAALVKEARILLDVAEGEKRDLTDEENQQYERVWLDIEKMGKEIDQSEQALARKSQLSLLETMNEETQGRSVTAAEPGHVGGDVREKINPRASEEYQEAFARCMRGGIRALSSDQYRALQADSDTAGGFVVVSEQFATKLIKAVDDNVFIRQKATVLTISKAESLGVPVLDSDPDDAAWTSELGTGSEDSSMDFGKRELRPHPLAKRIKVSNKLIRVASIDVEALVRDRLSYKFGITHEKGFLTGTGANSPLGLFTASAHGISTGQDISSGNTATDIKGDGLINAKYALKAQYRKNAEWMFHRDAVKAIRKLKDSNGDYIWKAGLSDRSDTILDLPFNESEYVPSTFTTGLYVGMLGDFSFYWIVDALDMQIQVLDQLYAETNQVGYIGRWESDGMPVLEEAFVRVKLA